uniref:Uncharacterized protein n=1 Tax=Candidatus Kentrum sp. TUN TaxID=2126343 RepID=A0A451A490_9GAMM|nr:MAG: hypothetical protein BECKTUN1418D_GA0071000_11375 [Candidatus Kentron sp. TUN]
MSKANINIIYNGPGLTESTMDVNDLAPALLALGDLIDNANFVLNGVHDRTKVRVNASFKTGSFGIDFQVAHNYIHQALTLTKDIPASEIATYLGFSATSIMGLVQFFKFLKGRPIKKEEIIDDENIRIFVDERKITIERKVLDLYKNHKLRESLEKLIYKPLKSDDINEFAITNDPKKGFVTVESNESEWFKSSYKETELLSEKVSEKVLKVCNPSFTGGKWRMSTLDDTFKFYSSISDREFQKRVLSAKESFTAGDTLKVMLKTTELQDGNNIKQEYDIIEVKEHNIESDNKLAM